MGAKIFIDRIEKIINVTEAPTLVDGELVSNFDIKIDLYSDAKEDWIADSELRVRKFPLSAVGGNPTVGSKSLGSTYFIDADWKIQLYPEDHRFLVNGNFYSQDGTSPFLLPENNSVLLEQEVSSLVDSTVNQLPEIEGMSFGGVVSIDLTSPYQGTAYPVGNMEYPVNNFADAVLIAESRGLIILSVRGDADISGAEDLSGFIIEGQNPTLSRITVGATANVYRTSFRYMTIAGTLDGDSEIKGCIIDGLDYVSGRIIGCGFTGLPVVLGGNVQASILDCWSEVAGDATPTIDAGGTGQSLIIRGYVGGIKFTNRTGTDAMSIDFESGQFIADSTISNGVIYVRGNVGKVTIECDPTLVDIYGVNNPRTIADAVWKYVNRELTGVDPETEAKLTEIITALSGVLDANIVKVKDVDVATIDDFKQDEILIADTVLDRVR